MSNRRTITVRRMPEQVTRSSCKALIEDLESCINVDRPAVVFDCSALRVLDRVGIHLLLCCLEEAMKRNGDIRLAGLQAEIRGILRSVEIDSLFQCFESVADAVESFHAVAGPAVPGSARGSNTEMNAA